MIESRRRSAVFRAGTAARGVSDEALAAKLVELDVLTSYQADQLKEGRTKLNLGPYIITDWIGQGGMGQVFKAVHEMMGRESAVKVLPLNKSTPQAIVNFTREIRTQAQLDHPNLVRAYDAGHDGNVYYLVTEFVPGMDLRRLIRTQTQGQPLSVQQAANMIMQAAKGLDYAHKRGLTPSRRQAGQHPGDSRWSGQGIRLGFGGLHAPGGRRSACRQDRGDCRLFVAGTDT